MKNTIIGWLFALSGIGLSIGGAMYHHSSSKNKPQKEMSSTKDQVASACPVCPTCDKAVLVASNSTPAPAKSARKGRALPMSAEDTRPAKNGAPTGSKDATTVAEVPPSALNAPMEMAAAKKAETMEAEKQAPKVDKKSILVYFKKNSTRLETEYYADIKKLIEGRKEFRFRIDVRTGEKKTKKDNRSYARRRGRVIRKLLMDAGIPKKHIQYRVFSADPEKSSRDYKVRAWRRTRITATPGGKK